MYKQKFGLVILPLAMVLTSAPVSYAQSATDKTDTQAVKPDNTKKNKRDRNKGEQTADQQKENSSDRELTRKIRRAIVSDKSLSTYAHNVKIITENGAVTLKGPVRTEEEKKAVEAKATEISGSGKVTNQISVKADSGKAKT